MDPLPPPPDQANSPAPVARPPSLTVPAVAAIWLLAPVVFWNHSAHFGWGFMALLLWMGSMPFFAAAMAVCAISAGIKARRVWGRRAWRQPRMLLWWLVTAIYLWLGVVGVTMWQKG